MSRPKKKKKNLFSETTNVTAPEISIHFNAAPPHLKPLSYTDNRRTEPRYRVEFETVVFCSGTSFRTKTINISVNGALLAESIPASFVDQVLDIVLIRHVGRVRDFFLIKGKGLEAPLRSPRIQFIQVPEAQHIKLKAIIQALAQAA